MGKKSILLFWCCIIPLMGLRSDYETVHVELSGEYPILPVYLSSNTTTDYQEALKRVLEFDLNHNGSTHVVPNHVDLERHARPAQWNTQAAMEVWDREGVYHLIYLDFSEGLVTPFVFSCVHQTSKKVSPLSLTHDLAKDRQKMHHLADAIHQVLFGQEAVASCRILYTRKTEAGSELIEADYDGYNKQVIHQQKELIVTPCYYPAPAGKKPSSCLFVSYESGQSKLFGSPTTYFSPSRITPLKGNQITPAVSKQRDKIAFISDAKGNPDLYLLELDEMGKVVELPRRIYGYPKATQASPTFSPDGKTIAFVSNKDGSARIYTMPVPTKEEKIRDMRPHLIRTFTKESTAPRWSPDGKKLAYCAKGSEGVRQIFVYDFDKQEERKLTSGPYDKENPVWGPNSCHLLFNARESDGSFLYLINLHQPKAFRLYQEGGENRFPDWG